MAEESRSDALQAAADKRLELKAAISQVEAAVASASGEPGWRDRLGARLEALDQALHRHVEEVEGSDGLLAELTRIAPRLVNQITHVRDEHPVLCGQAEAAIAAVNGTADVDVIRADVMELLAAIARHRQRGADLVYEGYDVDLGGG